MTVTAPATPTSPRQHVERFRAMGTDVQITAVDGDPTVIALARVRIEALETRWSRFRSGSDVSALNAAAGTWVPVAPETILLLERAVAGARATDGRYDPTVGAALVAHGYDRTFAEVADHAADLHPEPVVDGAWPAIELDPILGLACLPPGTVFDPGGIGKGLAADVVATELAGQAAGLLINLGGDLRLVGTPPDPAGWVVAIDDPHHPGASLGRLAVPGGAVATSSTTARRWSTADGPAHHVIDPTTGRPAAAEVASVTVVAAEAWWAEVQATSLLLQGPDGLASADETVQAAMVLSTGELRTTPGLAEVLT